MKSFYPILLVKVLSVYSQSDWDYSTTTSKYRNKFLMDNGLSILATTRDIKEALERGHARKDETIAVFLDTTM